MISNKNIKYILFTLIFCIYTIKNVASFVEDPKYKYEVKYYEVTVDHFNFMNNKTFKLRYLYNDSFVDKAAVNRSPLFFYAGNEGDVELFAQNTGFMWELAQKMKAYVVFAEHRYYGQSLPFGNTTFTDTANIGYLSIEQTLEDFAELIENLRAGRQIPVIAFGGSYGGMLAAWLRMKFPHVVQGSLAASAPVWQFDGLTPCDIFSKITTSVFSTSYSTNCSVNIKNTWNMFKTLFATEDGKKKLSDTLKLCDPLKQPEDLEEFMDYFEEVYAALAMANYPYANDFIAPVPAYPVRQFCLYLKDLQKNDTSLLNALHQALGVYTNYTGTTKCVDYKNAYNPSLGGSAWDIQTCNEIVMPMCAFDDANNMFRKKEWNFKEYSDKCVKKFNLRPRLNEITFRYGGKNLDSISNIIFSNGLLDPWCGGGVLRSPSDNNNIATIIIPEGAHHLDLRSANPKDPISVIEARKQESQIIAQWIADYLK